MTARAAQRETQPATLLDNQRRVLERIANGAPLAETFETLVRLIEEQAHGMRCAVLLADPGQQRLAFIAAPSIPEDYKQGIAPFLRIAPDMGSCGTAAFLREPVYTQDTATDSRWNNCRRVAVRNGLRAIWSTPILGDDNTVLGTFAMYYGEPRLPSPDHIQLIDMAVQMARVAIEAKRKEEDLKRGEDRLRLVIDTIPTMAWSVLPDGTVDFVNRRWLEYTGLSLEQALENPAQSVHPADLPSVMEKWSVDMAAGQACEYEMRLRRADGEYRWFLVRTVPLRDGQETVVKWYGAAIDIEDRKRTEDTLRRNQAFFVAEAQRIGRLLGTATAQRLEHSPGGDVAVPDESEAAGRPPVGAGGAEGAVPAEGKLAAERQALESLTPNERAIMRLIAEGKSNAEVGNALHLSPRTVETYRGRLMQKLQLEDIVGLVKFAIRHGIASVE